VADAFTLQAATDKPGLLNATTIDLTQIEIVGQDVTVGRLKEANAISSLEVLPGTRASFGMDGNCIIAKVPITGTPSNQTKGINLTLMYRRGQSAQEVLVGPGSTLRFCAAGYKDYMLLGKVSSVDVSRVHLSDTRTAQTLRTSSLIRGTLSLPDVNRTIDLKTTDRVSLKDVRDGWLIVIPGQHLRVGFTGRVGDARSVGLAADETGVLLSPTLIEWITRYSLFTSVFAFFTAFVGMIWSAIRYFGWS
jgi:hypothetical protein